jgi:hypothetical protein
MNLKLKSMKKITPRHIIIELLQSVIKIKHLEKEAPDKKGYLTSEEQR